MSSKNPAEIYLQSLPSIYSRVSMGSYIKRALQIISGLDDIESFNWRALNYESVYKLKDALDKEKKSPATINAYLSVLRSVAREAWRLDYIDTDTLHHILDVKRAKGTRESTGRALEVVELNTIIDHCLAQEGLIAVRDAALIALLYSAGLRRSEAAGLQLTSYNSNKGELSVIGKGNKQRIMSLNNKVIDILNLWLDERGSEPGGIFVRIYKNNKATNKSISGQTVYDVVARRYKEAKLERLTPHDLRKTFATQLLENGADIFTVQELMNHTSADTTKIYDKRNKKTQNKASKALPL